MYLEHVNLTVADLDKSAAFYCELLDFRVRWQGATTGGGRAAHVGDDGGYLALFEAQVPGPAQTTSARPTDTTRVGFNHLGFVVDDLEAMRSRLSRSGITPHHEADYEPGKRLYFFDPDGIEVELVQYQETESAVPVRGVSAAG